MPPSPIILSSLRLPQKMHTRSLPCPPHVIDNWLRLPTPLQEPVAMFFDMDSIKGESSSSQMLLALLSPRDKHL